MSGVFVVQGKLGGGKSLYCVSKAVPAIQEGLKVATNIDLHLSTIVGKNSSRTYVRLPDKPSKFDIESLGRGCPANSPEDKFGIIILDECAHWLNSRNWQSKTNQEMIQFLLYIRKLGWKVYFLIQNIKAMDKQARDLFAEHVVSCRRTDRMRIPVVSWLASLLDFKLTAPKVHVASIRYGDGQNAPLIGTDIYRGKQFYSNYDTNQIFTDDYQDGSYCVLPPKFRKRPPKTSQGKLIMGLTKIYLAKHNKTAVVALLGVVIYAVLQIYVFMPKFNEYEKIIVELERKLEDQREDAERLEKIADKLRGSPGVDSVEEKPGFTPEKKDIVFDSRVQVGDEKRVFFMFGDDRINSKQLMSMGFVVKDRGCSYIIQNLQTEEVHHVPSPCSS